MGKTFSKPKRLTQEQAKIVSETFLWGSKIVMRNSFKLVEEYFWNYDTELTNTKHTTIILSKGGGDFFIGHIEDRERYQGLVDIYSLFTLRILTKLKQVGQT